MRAPALATDEAERLEALECCGVLDTEPEEAFDGVVRLAARLTDSPISTISLIDRDRQWFKASVGIELAQTPRDISFCGHTILQTEMLEIEDARLDPRFASNPMVVGEPGVRFYAGVPLITSDGHALGALCVKDRRPRRLTAEQRDALERLAAQVVTQLELRHQIGALERETRLRRTAERQAAEGRERYWRILHCALDAIVAVDGDGRIIDFNPSAEALFGRSREESMGAAAAELIVPERLREAFRGGLEGAMNGHADEILGRRLDAIGMNSNGEDLSLEMTIARISEEPHAFVAFVRPRGGEAVPREELLASERKRRDYAQMIERAIEGNRFVLHAQPVFSLKDDSLHAHELLLRMRAADSGKLVMPGDFLPQAERYGLIADIDRWVVREGMRLAASHRVAINLSGASIGDTRLLALIEGQARANGVDPGNVIFELTETAAVSNLDRASRFVGHLVDLGFGFALDDFGTGFGSLTYVKHLPVDYLKIDLQFIRGLATSEADRRVVQSIVSVGRNFGMETIAEGVEGEETLQLLRELGVDHAQGFGLQRPAPLEHMFQSRPLTIAAR